jgi:hypothetical protein
MPTKVTVKVLTDEEQARLKQQKSEQNRRYYLKHKEERQAKHVENSRNYRERNKEAINTKKAENKVICECGTECRKDHLKRHLKTKRHLAWEEGRKSVTGEDEGINESKAEPESDPANQIVPTKEDIEDLIKLAESFNMEVKITEKK